MTTEEARDVVSSVLHQVAPEANIDDVADGETLQEALDLDSIDFLNFVIGLHEETGLEIPEKDYPQLATLDGCVTYLSRAS